jgi:hypothetical protein
VDLERLYAGSFVDWEAVVASWNKRTVPSRLLLFAARPLPGGIYPGTRPGARRVAGPSLPADEIKDAYASPPEADNSRTWGGFVDAAVAAEIEMVSYGDRPPLIHELRAGLEQAAAEAGTATELGRWFLARRDALPGTDLPDDPGYLPV